MRMFGPITAVFTSGAVLVAEAGAAADAGRGVSLVGLGRSFSGRAGAFDPKKPMAGRVYPIPGAPPTTPDARRGATRRQDAREREPTSGAAFRSGRTARRATIAR